MEIEDFVEKLQEWHAGTVSQLRQIIERKE